MDELHYKIILYLFYPFKYTSKNLKNIIKIKYNNSEIKYESMDHPIPL